MPARILCVLPRVLAAASALMAEPNELDELDLEAALRLSIMSPTEADAFQRLRHGLRDDLIRSTTTTTASRT